MYIYIRSSSLSPCFPFSPPSSFLSSSILLPPPYPTPPPYLSRAFPSFLLVQPSPRLPSPLFVERVLVTPFNPSNYQLQRVQPCPLLPLLPLLFSPSSFLSPIPSLPPPSSSLLFSSPPPSPLFLFPPSSTDFPCSAGFSVSLFVDADRVHAPIASKFNSSDNFSRSRKTLSRCSRNIRCKERRKREEREGRKGRTREERGRVIHESS